MKRRKLSPELYQASTAPPYPAPLLTTVPDTALLYHFALSAHRASHQHLQQAFVHPSISAAPVPGIPLAPLYNSRSTQPFIHDHNAAAKALDLQLVALDFLRAGLAYPDLSERERVAFGLEFGIVGLKVHNACAGPSTGKGKKSEKKQRVDLPRLIGDIQDVVGQSAEAYAKSHMQIVQLTAFTKARFVFVYRRWELASQTLSALSSVIGSIDDLSQNIQLSGQGDDRTWRASLIIHYMILRALWEGRIGNDNNARACLKQIYALMDETAENGIFNILRANGGVMMLNVPGDQPLQVQMTPPNILYMLTYLTTVVSRRDFTGSNSTCKNILHTKALREYEGVVRADDMWDSGFSLPHGIAHTQIQQKEVMIIRAEMMVENVTALMFRSEFEASYRLLLEIIDHLRTHDLFPLFAPHLCLLFAQYSMLVGIDAVATKYYDACRRLINQGSEFGLIADIGIMGSQGLLSGLPEHPERRDKVHSLAEKCKSSTSAMFNGAGHLLASLIDENVVNSKKQLSNAYEISVQSNNNILRLLIFAFTTSTHHYGGRDRMYRQLEAGKEVAKLMGGKDRADGVGQVLLGLWFAYRLKEYYRQEGDQERAGLARDNMMAHLNRLEEIKVQAAALERAAMKTK
uniref:Uncharacterized protein n=1 Tax=Kwoniella bestiolae CBS 10118 TaxID=1296100 RepID=A0A1B9GCW4_9TREE|nr:hypothetical protein I302_00337 [Kwoniella bestiolae CBS 10118]OCF28847.1 hypothetical protein I302_00337 [Kwoniella bestiolae CBS 10118]